MIDEASGVEDPIYEAIEGGMASGPIPIACAMPWGGAHSVLVKMPTTIANIMPATR